MSDLTSNKPGAGMSFGGLTLVVGSRRLAEKLAFDEAAAQVQARLAQRRAEFEEFAADNNMVLQLDSRGSYDDHTTNKAWLTWEKQAIVIDSLLEQVEQGKQSAQAAEWLREQVKSLGGQPVA